MSRKHAETAADIENVEAWAAIIENILYSVSADKRVEVLALATANEVREREKCGGLRIISAAELANMDTPGLRHWHAIMRLKSLLAQILIRDITNDNSAENAAAILFAEHPYGTGSGCLRDYLERPLEVA